MGTRLACSVVSCAFVLFVARSARADGADAPSLSELPPLPAASAAAAIAIDDDEMDEDDVDEDDPHAFVDAADYDALDDDFVLVPIQDRKPPPLPKPGDAKPGDPPRTWGTPDKLRPPRARGPKLRGPKRHSPTARIPRFRPHPHACPRPPKLPRPPKRPKAHRGPPPQAFGKMRMFFYKDQGVTRAGVHFERDARAKETRPVDDGRAHSGAAVSASGTRFFAMQPIGDVLIGGRLHLAAALPTIHQGSRWLSTGTIGLKGGIDLQTASAATAQLWHVGVAFGMGAPWSRDIVGVSVEGGILGGRYHDSRSEAFVMSQNRTTVGPYAENIGPNAYGAASLILQLPLRGNVRPFMSGDFGVTSRDDDKAVTMAGLRGGVVWAAW